MWRKNHSPSGVDRQLDLKLRESQVAIQPRGWMVKCSFDERIMAAIGDGYFQSCYMHAFLVPLASLYMEMLLDRRIFQSGNFTHSIGMRAQA